MEEGSETEGLPILNGDQKIPVSRPPCHDDENVCPKVKPGHSDFSPEAAEIYWYWKLCTNLDEHPEDMWYKRWKRILDSLVLQVERERMEAEREQMRLEREAMLKRRT